MHISDSLSKLLPPQQEEIREIFERIDIDGGGTIDTTEISTALKLFGIQDEGGEEEGNIDNGAKAAEEPLDFEAFVKMMKERSHLFDATEHITEQFLMFAGKDPDSDPDSVFIT